MPFRGMTFAGQNVTPKNDGGLYQAHYGDGILWGCAMNPSGDDLVIQSGEFIMGGRVVQVDGATYVDLSGRTLQTGYIQVIANIDLSQGEGSQFYTTWVERENNVFDSLTKDDINDTGTLYQLELAVVQISGGNLTNITSHMQPSLLISRGLQVHGVEGEYMPFVTLYTDGDYIGGINSVTANKDIRLSSIYNGSSFASVILSALGGGIIANLEGSGDFHFRPKGAFDTTNQVIINQNGQIIGGHFVTTSEKSTSTALPTNTGTDLVTSIPKPSWAKFGIQFGYASINRNAAGRMRVSVTGYSQDNYVPDTSGFLVHIAGITTGTSAFSANPTNGTGTCTYAKLEVIWF